MAGGGVHWLRMTRGRAVAAAIICRTQMRTALEHLARNPDVGQASVVACVLAAATGVHRDTIALRGIGLLCVCGKTWRHPFLRASKGATPNAWNVQFACRTVFSYPPCGPSRTIFIRSYYVRACSIIGLWSNRRPLGQTSILRPTLRLKKSLSIGSASIGGLRIFRTAYACWRHTLDPLKNISQVSFAYAQRGDANRAKRTVRTGTPPVNQSRVLGEQLHDRRSQYVTYEGSS